MGADIFGLVVNPRDGRLYLAVGSIESGHVTVCDTAARRMGNGYLDKDPDSKYAASAEVTGFPRVHTPDGVTGKGSGLGTVLYTALCARAHLGAQDMLDLPKGMPGRGGDGISSETASRSAAADAWWDRARERFGLAQEVKGCVDETFGGEQEVSAATIRDALGKKFGVDPKQITLGEYELRASGYYQDCDRVFDAYPYANARDAHLVVALVNSEYEEPKLTGIDPGNVVEVDPLALAAVNVAALRPTVGNEGVAARQLGWLLAVAEHAKVPAKDRDQMRLRFLAGVDAEPPAWSDVLDPSGYTETRENPSAPWLSRSRRLGPTWVYASGRRRIVPRRWGASRPVRLAPPATAPRSNPGSAHVSESGALGAVKSLGALRASLGWDSFVDDVPPAPRRSQNRSRHHPTRRRR